MRRKRSILFSLMFIIVVVVTAASALFTGLLVQHRTKDLINEADARLLTAAEFARELLGPDYHDRIVDASSVSKERFRQIVARNDGLCRRLHLQYLWSVLLVDNRIVFTSATHSNLTDPNSPYASFFETHRDPGSFAPALTSEGTVSFSSFKNEWGRGRQVLVPRKDARGRTYIFGASVQLTELEGLVRRTVFTSVGIGLAILAGALLLAVALARSVTAPIARLTEAAKRMATGDLDVPPTPSGTHELQSLSDSLDQMRRGIKQYVANLQESEEQFKAIFETASIGVAQADLQCGQWLRVNRKMCEITGYSSDELRTRSISEITHPDDRQRDWKAFQDVVSGKEPSYTLEKRCIRKDGQIIWVNVNMTLIRDAAGQPLHSVATIEDITTRKRAEQALRESEERYQSLFEQAGDGILVLDAHGNILSANKSFATMHGFTVEEVLYLGLDGLDVEGTGPAPERIKKIMRGETLSFEVDHYHKDGHTFALAVTANLVSSGSDRLILVIHRDLTERKQAEEALRRMNAFLDSIVENIPDMIFLKDARELRFVLFNRAGEDLLGSPRTDLLGKNDYDFFPKEQADFFVLKDHEVLSGKEVVDIPEEPVQTRHKGERILHTKKVPILDAKGEAEYLLGISEDITSRKQAEKQIKASLKEKEVLLREVHHRVKNNMQVISSLLNMQLRNLTDAKTADIFRASIDRIRSMALIHDKLYQTEGLSRIDVRDYVQHLSGNLLNAYSVGPGIMLDFDVDPLFLDIDTVMPLGILINELVTNSIKHAFPGDRPGRIDISLKKGDGQRLVLAVSDNGIGIPAHLDHTDTQSVGMQLVVTLVEQLEGAMELNRDNGTEFRVVFRVEQIR